MGNSQSNSAGSFNYDEQLANDRSTPQSAEVGPAQKGSGMC